MEKIIEILIYFFILIFAIDLLEAFFPNTRKVHIIHNFPDILNINFPENPSIYEYILAGYSGIKVAILPAIIILLLIKYKSYTMNENNYNNMINDCMFITKYGLNSILLLLIFIGIMKLNILQQQPFLIHQLMYLISCLFIMRLLYT